jgi:hypothetical protein
MDDLVDVVHETAIERPGHPALIFKAPRAFAEAVIDDGY